jgi:cytochrome P450
MSSEPSDPIVAATHADPYPYYARLVAERPLYRDSQLQLWVASSASVVAQVLASELCRVRPAAEPVPRALGDNAAAAIFQRLVRQTDGAEQRRGKQAIAAVLARLQPGSVATAARHCAAELVEELQPQRQLAAVTSFNLALPVRTIAMLLGVPRQQIGCVADRVGAFAASITPTASAMDIEQGAAAAAALLGLFQQLLPVQSAQPDSALLGALAREMGATGATADEVIIANGIGLMSQSYEATAGLIGNTLLALAQRPTWLTAVSREPALLANLIQHVLCVDPPTQSTRRFVAQSGDIAGQAMQVGDVILVMLAAAGRDPGVLPHPTAAALENWQHGPGNFGAGIHACPAGAVAAQIAAEGITHLLALGVDPCELAGRYRYRASNHLRVPVFG